MGKDCVAYSNLGLASLFEIVYRYCKKVKANERLSFL